MGVGGTAAGTVLVEFEHISQNIEGLNDIVKKQEKMLFFMSIYRTGMENNVLVQQWLSQMANENICFCRGMLDPF